MKRKLMRLGIATLTATSLMVSTRLTVNASGFTQYIIPDEYIRTGGELEEQVQRFIYRFSGENGLDYAMVLAMIETESGYHSDSVSSCGAVGYMQIMTKWHAERMDVLGVTDPMDPMSNVMIGIDYMGELTCNYPIELALMIYNEGNLAISKWNKGIKQTSYTKTVLEKTQRIRKELDDVRIMSP